MMLWRRSLAASLTSGNTPHEITNPGAARLALPNARMTARPRGVRLASSPVFGFLPPLGRSATHHLAFRLQENNVSQNLSITAVAHARPLRAIDWRTKLSNMNANVDRKEAAPRDRETGSTVVIANDTVFIRVLTPDASIEASGGGHGFAGSRAARSDASGAPQGDVTIRVTTMSQSI